MNPSRKTAGQDCHLIDNGEIQITTGKWKDCQNETMRTNNKTNNNQAAWPSDISRNMRIQQRQNSSMLEMKCALFRLQKHLTLEMLLERNCHVLRITANSASRPRTTIRDQLIFARISKRMIGVDLTKLDGRSHLDHGF